MSSINSETVVAFLKVKGWKQAGRDDRYVHLCAPQQGDTEQETLYIPVQELKGTSFYDLSMQSVVRTIGVIYNLKERDLMPYFAKSIDEIGREVSFHQAILAHAS